MTSKHQHQLSHMVFNIDHILFKKGPLLWNKTQKNQFFKFKSTKIWQKIIIPTIDIKNLMNIMT